MSGKQSGCGVERRYPCGMDTTIDARDTVSLRRLLGRFCTGVTVVATKNSEGDVVGFACQSFSALSLDPPMILISVMRTSNTLPVLLERGEFTVSVLGEEAQAVSATVGSRAADKFARVPLGRTRCGLPVLRDALAWFDCSVSRVVEGGDHIVILADVRDAGPVESDSRPLLFFNGCYGELSRPEPATVAPERELAAALSVYHADEWY